MNDTNTNALILDGRDWEAYLDDDSFTLKMDNFDGFTRTIVDVTIKARFKNYTTSEIESSFNVEVGYACNDLISTNPSFSEENISHELNADPIEVI